jgi:hypothetical protein
MIFYLIKIFSSDDKDEKFEALTKSLKEKILNYFSGFPDPMDPKIDLQSVAKSFNELTLELLRIFFLLLQFGFFKLETCDYSSHKYYEDKNNQNKGWNPDENNNDLTNMPLIYKILRILAFLLEFDLEYFNDLQYNNINRGIFFI